MLMGSLRVKDSGRNQDESTLQQSFSPINQMHKETRVFLSAAENNGSRVFCWWRPGRMQVQRRLRRPWGALLPPSVINLLHGEAPSLLRLLTWIQTGTAVTHILNRRHAPEGRGWFLQEQTENVFAGWIQTGEKRNHPCVYVFWLNSCTNGSPKQHFIKK